MSIRQIVTENYYSLPFREDDEIFTTEKADPDHIIDARFTDKFSKFQFLALYTATFRDVSKHESPWGYTIDHTIYINNGTGKFSYIQNITDPVVWLWADPGVVECYDAALLMRADPSFDSTNFHDIEYYERYWFITDSKVYIDGNNNYVKIIYTKQKDY